MRQIRQTRRTTPNPGSPLDDPFAANADLATITHGPFAEQIPIAGLTVGSVRRRFRDRYNLPADGFGMLDGSEVDDDTVVQAGQILTFMHRASSKGVDSQESAAQRLAAMRAQQEGEGEGEGEGPRIEVVGHEVLVRNPGSADVRAPLAAVCRRLQPRWFGETVWPDGVKIVKELPRGAIVVHQTPARVHNLHWIAADSAAEFGKEAKYRGVRVALPYVVLVAVYRVARNGRLQLSTANECFFANAPLSSASDPMCYPALLNVSKMPEPTQKRPLAWCCTQYLNRSFERIEHEGERARHALRELARHMLEDGFNRSSEHNEGASWFGETVAARVDPRIQSIESWEEATVADPMFATDVKWLPTGLTLQQIMDRITSYMELGDQGLTATAVAHAAMRCRTEQPEQSEQSEQPAQPAQPEQEES